MNKFMRLFGVVLATTLFLCGEVRADSVVVSTFVIPSETAIIPATQFTKMTITLLNPTTNLVYLTSFPAPTTTQAVTDGLPLYPSVSASSNTMTLPDYHGDLYGVAPGAQAGVRINFLGGQ